MTISVIWNITQNKYVSRPGTARSFTKNLQYARTWPTRQAAHAETCSENEIAMSVEEAMS